MANDYFRFKKFTVNQADCAMKVCTDSCLFGAYIEPGSAAKILDIGTGTGLLALMMAQKTAGNAAITAVELDPGAAEQARGNVAASDWSSSIKVVEQSIQEHAATATDKFDLIISNPPFFSKQLKRATKAQNMAMHSDALSLEELVGCVSMLLGPEGKFAVLLPPEEADVIRELASAEGLLLQRRCKIFAIEEGRHLRTVTVFGFASNFQPEERAITIKSKEGNYTEDFVALLKDFYLHL
jgi:tRNA1Val (adenine37-N6)-methyltransferase